MNTPQSGQNSGESKKPDLPDDLLLELGADDEAELLPDHLVPEAEETPSSGAAPAASAPPDKNKALQNIASQLMFAEAMASANASKEFALPKTEPVVEPSKQEPAAKQPQVASEPPLAKLAETAPPPPAAAPASGAQSASSPAAEKSGGLKVPKFLKRTFEAAALKGFAAQLFGDDSSATSDAAPAQPTPPPPVQPPAQTASTAVPPAAPLPAAQAPVQPVSTPVPPPVPRPPAQPAVQSQSPAVPPAVPRPATQAPAQPAPTAASPAAPQPVAQAPVRPASTPVPPPVPRPPAQPAVQPQSSAVPPAAPQTAPEYAAVKVPKFLKKSFEANALKGFAAHLIGPEEGEAGSTPAAASAPPASPAAAQASPDPAAPQSPVSQPASGVPAAAPGLNQSVGAIKVPRFLKRTFEANAMKGIAAQLFEDDGSASGSAALGTAGSQPSAVTTPPTLPATPSAALAPATQNPQPAPAASTPALAPAPAPPVQPTEVPAKQKPAAEVQSSAPQATAPELPPFENLSPGPPPIPKKKSTAELWNPYGHEEDESDLLPDHLVPASEASETTSTAAPGKGSPTKVPKFLKKSFESTALKNIATQIWGEDAVAEAVGPEPVEVSTPEGAAPTTEAGARWLAENAAAIEAAGAPSPNSAKEAAEAFEQMMRDRGVIPKEVKKTHLDPEAMRDFAKYTKTKEEERLKFELEFRSEPTIAKPSCPIENYTKASECPVKWDEMVGKTRVRFCERCEQQVYDLSKLDQSEAEELVVKREGKSDLTYYRRADGKWQIKDCPIGAKKLAKLRLTLGLAVGAGVLLVGLFFLSFFKGPTTSRNPDSFESSDSGIGTTVVQPQYATTKAPPLKVEVPHAPNYEVPMLPENSNASLASLYEAPVLDENGVMSHPHFGRRVILTPGSYPDPSKPAPYKLLPLGAVDDSEYVSTWERSE